MKITNLTLTAFRSFVATTFQLDAPRVMIVGLNGAGKSTIRESIRYLLTGKAQGLDQRGSGVEVLRPAFVNGNTSVAVGAAINGLALERTWSPVGGGLVVQGFTGNTTAQQSGLYDRLKTTEAFVEAVIDSGVFLNLHHADAKALVLALLGVRVRIEDVVYTLDELDAAYKKAYDERRVVKAQKVFVPPQPAPQDFAPMDAIDSRLKQLHEQAETLAADAGAVVERRRNLAQLKINFESAIAHFGTLEIPTDLPVQIAELEERLAIMEADITDEAPTVPSNTDLAEGVSVAVLRNRAEALAAHKPAGGCVLDPDVKCETAKVNFSKRAKAILAEIDGLPAAVPALPAAVKPPSPLTELRRRLEGLKAQQAKYEAEADERRRVQTSLDTTVKELTALPDTSAQEAQMQDIRARIVKGEGIRKAAAMHQTACQAHETGVQQAQAHEADVQRLEALCDVLGPKGARVAALADALGPFEAAVNSLTQGFGWTVKFSIEPWEVVVNGRPVDTYSRSEQYRIGIALQLSIAQMSGLSFAVVDELDMLDAKNRNAIGQMLYKSPLEQIIILSTREAEMPLPKIPNMAIYRLGMADGRSSIIEQVPA